MQKARLKEQKRRGDRAGPDETQGVDRVTQVTPGDSPGTRPGKFGGDDRERPRRAGSGEDSRQALTPGCDGREGSWRPLASGPDDPGGGGMAVPKARLLEQPRAGPEARHVSSGHAHSCRRTTPTAPAGGTPSPRPRGHERRRSPAAGAQRSAPARRGNPAMSSGNAPPLIRPLAPRRRFRFLPGSGPAGDALASPLDGRAASAWGHQHPKLRSRRVLRGSWRLEVGPACPGWLPRDAQGLTGHPGGQWGKSQLTGHLGGQWGAGNLSSLGI